jgi:hypothetical protein
MLQMEFMLLHEILIDIESLKGLIIEYVSQVSILCCIQFS